MAMIASPVSMLPPHGVGASPGSASRRCFVARFVVVPTEADDRNQAQSRALTPGAYQVRQPSVGRIASPRMQSPIASPINRVVGAKQQAAAANLHREGLTPHAPKQAPAAQQILAVQHTTGAQQAPVVRQGSWNTPLVMKAVPQPLAVLHARSPVVRDSHIPVGPVIVQASGIHVAAYPMPTPLRIPVSRDSPSTTPTFTGPGQHACGSKDGSTWRCLSPRQTAQPNPQGNEGKDTLVGRITTLVSSGTTLKDVVARNFSSVACGRPSLDIVGLMRLRSMVAAQLDLPEAAFEDVRDDYVRFDFNGDNSLQEHECYRLVKHHLRKYRKQLGHAVLEVKVPYKTLQGENFTIIRELGKGSQGVLKLAVDASGQQRCIKILSKSNANLASLDELKDEYSILHHMHNTRIAKIFDIFQDFGNVYLVNEPYFGGDFTYLRERASQKGVAMTETWWKGIFRQLFSGLAYMHKHALMHCDIKEPNIMLKTENLNEPDVVFVDFGLAQEFVSPKIKVSGTPGYIPPETWMQQKWFPKGDVFSTGICMTQLVVDRVPVLDPVTGGTMGRGIFIEGAASIDDVRTFTVSRPAPLNAVQQFSPALARLVSRLLEKDMTARTSAVEALNDPWFSEDLAPPNPAQVALPQAKARPKRRIVPITAPSDPLRAAAVIPMPRGACIKTPRPASPHVLGVVC
mmetsp:Transcript_41818/g.115237  ORF Transcript_41818/g.115237 Transcript_41818/m.115237 type:complete len:686 (-) Transcript_41818:130-2187(-)